MWHSRDKKGQDGSHVACLTGPGIGRRASAVRDGLLRSNLGSYDLLPTRLENDGRTRLLMLMDEYTRECLVIDEARKSNEIN